MRIPINAPNLRLTRVLPILQTFPRSLKIAWDSAPLLVIVNITLVLITGVIPALSIYLMKLIVDGVIKAVEVHSRSETSHVLWLVALWSGSQLLAAVLGVLGQLVASLQRDLLGNHVNVLLIEKANQLDLSYFENATFYDKMERAQREASSRPAQVLNQLLGLLRSILTLASVLGILASLSAWLVLLVTIASIPAVVVQAKYSTQYFSLLTKRAPEQRKLSYLSWLLTTDTPVKELRVFGLHGALLRRYKEIFAKFFRENRDLAIRRNAAQIGLVVFSSILSGLMYMLVVLRVIAGRITVGGLTLYYQAFQQSSQSMNMLLVGFGSMYEHALYLSNLFDFLDYVPELPVRPDPLPMPDPIREGITIEHVSFKYPGTDKWVLRDISFAIRPGETIALVGANGAGKTTLVKLLARLYDPTEGRIRIDGIDLREFDPQEVRARVGVIFQDYVKYQLTVRENVGFGRVEAMADEARIKRAAAAAGADGVIEALPQGYDTPLGRWFVDGQELSIGQWQKVAIARAFMRDADLLILDEPTSSLDVRSEYEVFQAFGELTEGKMAVLISHRFSTVRMAGRIVVIEDGCVIEGGSHDELVLKGGRYAELFDMQAASYR